MMYKTESAGVKIYWMLERISYVLLKGNENDSSEKYLIKTDCTVQ